MAGWCESPSGANPLRVAIQQRVEDVTNEIQQQLTSLELVEKAHAKHLDQLRQQRETFAKEDSREASHAGRPLWKLCDFRETFDPNERGGFEGALQASGLLDAWVTPSGEFLKMRDGKAVLVAATS